MEATSAAQMVEPPVCDIYLCDYCGADFSTLTAIKVHSNLYVCYLYSLHLRLALILYLLLNYQSHEEKCVADKVLEAHSSNNLRELDTKEMDQVNITFLF